MSRTEIAGDGDSLEDSAPEKSRAGVFRGKTHCTTEGCLVAVKRTCKEIAFFATFSGCQFFTLSDSKVHVYFEGIGLKS